PLGAVTLGGAVDGFRLELAPPGTSICVALPEAATRSADCVGLDVEELRRAVYGSSVTDVSVVRRHGEDYLVHYSVEPGKDYRAVLGAYTNELTKLLGKKVSVKETLTHVHLGEVEVFGRSFTISRSAVLGGSNEIQYFLVPGKTALHAISVVAPESVAPHARSEIFSALEHATVEVSFFARLWRTVTKHVVAAIVGIGVLAGAVAVALGRRRRERGEAEKPET
ncbi:MAG TPA: hypothetical protein VF103_17000, partial [Polyangiaceae bacterium]